MRLCDNCLEAIPSGVHSEFPVGFERGTQRDPYSEHLTLCLPCQIFLGGASGAAPTKVDLAAFHARFQSATAIDRAEVKSPSTDGMEGSRP